MFEGIDEAVDRNRVERRAALMRLEGEYRDKGLDRSGPLLRETANELGRRYEALARQLFDMASMQSDATAAYTHVIDRLRMEYGQFRTELTDVVTANDGGTAALKAALEVMDSARDQVDAYIQGAASRHASGVSPRPEEHAVLLTEDGDVLTTEDGEPIELEGDARVTEDGAVRVTEDGAVRRTEDSDRRVTEDVALGDTVEAEVVRASVPASGWTGRFGQAERVQIIKSLAPVAQSEILELIERVDEHRFNDDLTQDALAELKRLHEMLGQLIEAAEHDKPLDKLLAAFGQSRDALFNLLTQGANVVVAAPALTFGIVKLLSALCGVAMDGGLVGAVYAAMLYKLCGKGKG